MGYFVYGFWKIFLLAEHCRVSILFYESVFELGYALRNQNIVRIEIEDKLVLGAGYADISRSGTAFVFGIRYDNNVWRVFVRQFLGHADSSVF